MEKQTVAHALGALTHPVRLDAIRERVVAGPPGRVPSQLARALGDIASATMSFHLKGLAAAGRVHRERASRNIVCRAARERMNGLLGYLTRNCCAGADRALERSAAHPAAEATCGC